jgi:tetratricopeptide (TPR) repeat protein
MKTRAGRIEVQVAICIEALSDAPKEKRSLPRLLAVTAFSPTVEPFYNEGRRALLQGKCTLFANAADFGGSRVFARAENVSLWFTEKDGSRPIPKGSEALLIVEADLEKQFEIRKSAGQNAAVTDMRVYPIFYAADSIEAQAYAELVELITTTKPTVAEISTRVTAFTNLNPKVFPKFLQDKLAHYAGHIASVGTISPEEAVRWITPVEVPHIPSTDGLRWELCNRCMEAVHGLILSGKHVEKARELSEVYFSLLTRRDELAALIQPRGKTALGTEQLKIAPRSDKESPFIDRDAAFDKIRQFFNQQQTSAFILGGMRGIGKTMLVQEAFRQAIPPRKRISLQLTEGMSYQRLLAELAFKCNLVIPDDLDLSGATVQAEVKQRILSYLGQGPGAVVVFDDFQFLLTGSGEIENAGLRDLVIGLVETGQLSRTKFFFISHISPRLGLTFENYCVFYTLQGLQARDTERLLVSCLQFARDDLAGQLPAPAERLVSILGGHPLATRLAARRWAEHPMADIAGELSVFKEFRDTIVSFILETLTLSPGENELLSFASIFRLPAPREVFLNWRKEEASYLLGSLTGRYLIDTSEDGYQLHPLIRSFFNTKLSREQAITFHKIAAKFYLKEFEHRKKTSKQVVPEYLGEAVHHFLAAGERQKASEFAFYAEELRPVASEHYKRGDYKAALKDYLVLLQLDPNDAEAHFRLSLISARNEQWGDAELHFGRAITLKPKAHWIFQGFGAAKIRAGKIYEGEALLLEAEKINDHYSPTLVDLGHLRETQGQTDTAEAYYRRAIDVNPNDSFAHYRLARLLYREGDIQQAYQAAIAALTGNPTSERNKDLVRDLKRKIDDNKVIASR